MAETSCGDCSAHGRIDEKIGVLEREIHEIKEDLKNKNRSNWQVVVSIGLSLFSVGLGLFVTFINGGGTK